MTRLLLDGLNAGIIGSVAVLLVVLASPRSNLSVRTLLRSGLREPIGPVAGIAGQPIGRFADNQIFEYHVMLPRFTRVWFIDGHENWARDCDFEMAIRTSLLLTRTFVRW